MPSRPVGGICGYLCCSSKTDASVNPAAKAPTIGATQKSHSCRVPTANEQGRPGARAGFTERLVMGMPIR